MRPRRELVLILATISFAGCSGRASSPSASTTAPVVTATPTPGPAPAPLVLTAGVEALAAAPTDQVSSTVDLARLGLTSVSAVYELTTPAGEPFAFHAFSREDGNSGAVQLSLAHVRRGAATPQGGLESLGEAGFVPGASGARNAGDWLDVLGDGFARITVRGRITEEQVLALRAVTARGTTTALVRLAIGPRSRVNVEDRPGPGPLVKEARTIYSSDSWRFGLPTIATSGDRTSVVCYEGDAGDPYAMNRYEMRLQYEGATQRVTGGGSVEASPDSGNWRDHEVAALYNVLAVAHAGAQDVSVRLSCDRGATFAQSEVVSTAVAGYAPRLVQVDMAADYTLAVAFWRNQADLSSELVLVEGRPSALDASGSPTRFAFGPAQVVHRDAADVTPQVMGVRYSAGGDLVIGYSFTRRDAANPMLRRTRFHCAVRVLGASAFEGGLVDEEVVESFDPSVALAGQGAALSILYAYEAQDGVRLRSSADAGRTWSGSLPIGGATAHAPAVLRRAQGGLDRVDVLYLRQAQEGTELHVRHWDHFDGSAGVEQRLAAASGRALPSGGYEVTQVAWLGYDAVVDGDDVVLVYDEQTHDAGWIRGLPAVLGAPNTAAVARSAFVPASPPPLAPGMTQAVPAPDPAHMHQLRWVRLD